MSKATSDEATKGQAGPLPGVGAAIPDLLVADLEADRGWLGDALTDRLVADVKARDEIGVQRYGQRLRAGNGRDALTDAYQEALDLSAYTRQMLAEAVARGEDADGEIRYLHTWARGVAEMLAQMAINRAALPRP